MDEADRQIGDCARARCGLSKTNHNVNHVNDGPIGLKKAPAEADAD